MTRVVLFPFSKEVHTLVRFADLLRGSLELTGIIDYTCDEGDAGEALGLPAAGIPVRRDDALLATADALFVFWGGEPLPHFAPLYRRHRVWQRFTRLLEAARARGLRIASLVRPSRKLVKHCVTRKIEIEVWRGTDLDVQRARRAVATPRLGIAGTGPCVGKFTTALFLERELTRTGVRVGSIATEEAGALLSDVALTDRGLDLRGQMAAALAALRRCDVIVSSGQGGLLDGGLAVNNRPWTVSYQLRHFEAFRPDAVLLVGRPSDDARKLRDATATLELMSRGRPRIALVVPEAEEVGFQRYRRLPERSLERIRARWARLGRAPAFVLRSDGAGVRELARHVIATLGLR